MPLSRARALSPDLLGAPPPHPSPRRPVREVESLCVDRASAPGTDAERPARTFRGALAGARARCRCAGRPPPMLLAALALAIVVSAGALVASRRHTGGSSDAEGEAAEATQGGVAVKAVERERERDTVRVWRGVLRGDLRRDINWRERADTPAQICSEILVEANASIFLKPRSRSLSVSSVERTPRFRFDASACAWAFLTPFAAVTCRRKHINCTQRCPEMSFLFVPKSGEHGRPSSADACRLQPNLELR